MTHENINDFDSESGDESNGLDGEPPKNEAAGSSSESEDKGDHECIPRLFLSVVDGEVRWANGAMNNDAVRNMSSQPGPKDGEDERNEYPGISTESWQPREMADAVAHTLIELFFLFFLKVLWVEIFVGMNRYRMQSIDARARVIKTKQKARRVLDSNAPKRLRFHPVQGFSSCISVSSCTRDYILYKGFHHV
ncbi:hypothetical protein PybrP1_005239 [[Pythium] brassicae (nom. inval.)]|nr:hypothetical protein PybrP1_005239 [[Pythium] brassicae (nom. inval.)]